MKLKIFKICLISLGLFGASAQISAQQSQNAAEKEFDDYEQSRNLFQTTNKTSKPVGKRNRKVKVGKKRINRPVSTPSSKSQISSIGAPGMKIWAERQTQCRGKFTAAAPTAVFNGADCIRIRFSLNFEGFLTIINLGTSGKNKVIFPDDGQSTRIFPKSDNFIPDNEGWMFEKDPGNEQLVFIVSQSEIKQALIDEYLTNQSLVTTESKALEVYDRDIVPRSEKNSVYVLSNDERLEKPLVFRMTIKHR